MTRERPAIRPGYFVRVARMLARITSALRIPLFFGGRRGRLVSLVRFFEVEDPG